MTFIEWVQDTVHNVNEDGWDGAKDSVEQLRIGAFRRLDWLSNGVHIYEHDWDLLIVLDGCRYDLMEEVVEEYNFLESIERFNSVGSSSSEWLRRNFTEDYRDEIEHTIHVTGNPNSKQDLLVREFSVLDEVWEYEWDDDLGTIYPDAITDRAIALHREHSPERMLVHYMQPHHPFIENPIGEGFGESDPWSCLQKGDVQRETVWQKYRQNLKYVLNHLPLLLRNVDAEKVIITADHGNLLGEYGLYGHPAKVAVSELRTVPWCKTTVEDTGEYEPTLVPSHDQAADVAERRLADLGYR
ncbi:hydrolase [Haloterrigena salifodinae]|uniref:Hydrolase n=1 Tax=Haloterrigena salifodinae TaxID=2675099 RepID=A0A8T8DWQ4_9EURY|nr:hydrolase [Haloterrigena salifodinae]QRV13989.1 hydrolase [Haloterrigena salifodinae]